MIIIMIMMDWDNIVLSKDESIRTRRTEVGPRCAFFFFGKKKRSLITKRTKNHSTK